MLLGEIILPVTQIVNTEQLQYYVPYKRSFKYIIVNILHKGDSKDDEGEEEEEEEEEDDDNNNNNNNV